MARRVATRQRVRSALIITSLLLFPVTMNYLSPYVIIDGASQGIVNGSLIMFSLMFLSALLVGRLWCGWACPAAGLAEICFAINDEPVKGKRLDWIKWAIWVPWLMLIVWLAVRAGGYHRIDFLHLTEGGISVAHPEAYVIYYMVIGIFGGLAVFVGRRAGCHAICWMAPFMILGRKIRSFFRWSALGLQADASACTNCKTCTRNCPMSLDVNGMVQRGAMENAECILCGSCVDGCPRQTIRYAFSAGK